MGKKILKLTSFFKTKEIVLTKKFLPFCVHPTKTISFRCNTDIFKTVNSVFFDQTDQSLTETPKSLFTTTSEESSFSTESEEYYCNYNDVESLETLVRGVKLDRSSERLFFEAEDTSSILEKAKADGFPFKESVVLAIDSEDPHEDFKRSMKEMVESHGLKDWECLEELLRWYLKVNGKNNHGFIVGAFVDMLISVVVNNSNCSDLTTLYSLASSPLCSCEEGQSGIITKIKGNNNINVTAS